MTENNNNNNKQKEPSVLEKTLLREDFQIMAGANFAKKYYGEKGKQVANIEYGSLMNSKGINEFRNQIYETKKIEYKIEDSAEEPDKPTDKETSRLILKQIREIMEMSKLGELYNVIKKVAPDLDFKVPEQIKNITQSELMKIAMDKKAYTKEGNIDASKLTKEEQAGFSMYQTLSQAYRETNALNLMNKATYQGFNAAGKAINESLNPEKKEEKNKEAEEKEN